MFHLSSYFSVEYMLVLLPLSVGLYLILPQKLRRLSLLLCSWVFFWAVSGRLIVYLLLSILLVYLFGLWLGKVQEEQEAALAVCQKQEKKTVRGRYRARLRNVCILGVVLHIGILLAVKYTPFISDNLNVLLRVLHLPVKLTRPVFAAPVGISFYTMQAASYLLDVHRGKIRADRNLLRIALYMSFFPQIMEGPICRYEDTAMRLWEAPRIRYDALTQGTQRILWGLMKKTVVADRLNLLIENVFSGYEAYDGCVIALAVVCYTVQLYMDFSGTMDVVIGTGQIFGIEMPENFRRPFFSRTISEFWARWHITLGTWFRDYLFYPLSVSKPLKKLTSRARKRFGNHYGPLFAGGVALACVWLCNGLWHGAGWHYIVFGLYHFALILTGSLLAPPAARIAEKLHIQRDHIPYRILQTVRTFLLVCVGELIFRALSLRQAAGMLKKICMQFTLDTFRDGSLFAMGMDRQDYIIVLVALGIVFAAGFVQERGLQIRKHLAGRNLGVRLAAGYALILFIVIFGAYGQGYLPVNPIYAGF